jgi:toxin ParE1/3/4
MSASKPALPKRAEYSDRALDDLEDIWIHIAEDSEDYANNAIAYIIEKFSTLLRFPKLGRERNELLVGLRSLVSGKYVIFYQETTAAIQIVRVLHGARDVNQAFDDMIPPLPASR